MADWSNPWKLTSLAMALVIVTAVITGVVVAKWSGKATMNAEEVFDSPAAMPRAAARVSAPSPPPPPARIASREVAVPVPAAPRAAALPSQSVVDDCNRYAGAARTTKDKTIEVVKDAAIGAVAGAAVGAVGGAIADGGKGAGKGAAIGGLAGAGGGSLYGLYENKKNDEAYKEAYASCMRRHGYPG
jgi:hypothetical protein